MTDDLTLLKHSLNHLNEEMFKEIDVFQRHCVKVEKLLGCCLCNTFSPTYEKSYDHFIQVL